MKLYLDEKELPLPISTHFMYFETDEDRENYIIDNYGSFENFKKIITGDEEKYYLRIHLQLINDFFNEGGLTPFSEYIKIVNYLSNNLI